MVKRATSQDQNEPRPADDEPSASPVVTEPSQAHRAIYDAALAQGPEFVKELMGIVKYRGRGSNLATSLEAVKILFGMIGINTQGDSQKAGCGTIINSSGPMQVVGKSQAGPDRLTQELIDIVRAGNRASGNGRK